MEISKGTLEISKDTMLFSSVFITRGNGVMHILYACTTLYRPGDELYNRTEGWSGQENCAAPCYSPYFTRYDFYSQRQNVLRTLKTFMLLSRWCPLGPGKGNMPARQLIKMDRLISVH